MQKEKKHIGKKTGMRGKHTTIKEEFLMYESENNETGAIAQK